MQDLSTAFTLTLDQAIDGWILHLKARNLSPMTIKAYRAAATGLDGFLRRSGMTSDIDQISSEYIEAYLADEVATKAAATAHQRYRGLKQLFAWLTSQGERGRNRRPAKFSTSSRPGGSRIGGVCSTPRSPIDGSRSE